MLDFYLFCHNAVTKTFINFRQHIQKILHMVYFCLGRKLLSHVWLLWPPPGSSVDRIFQVRILEWVAISSSRGSSQSRDRTHVSCITGRFFTVWATREVLSTINFFKNTFHFFSTKIWPCCSPLEFDFNVSLWVFFLKSLLNLFQYYFCLIFWVFGCKVCGILVSGPEMETAPPAFEGEVLTAGLPGKSHPVSIFKGWRDLFRDHTGLGQGRSGQVHHFCLAFLRCVRHRGVYADPLQSESSPGHGESWLES